MSASNELERNKEESMVSPKDHGDKEQETLTEARARVEQLWKTILGTGNNSEGERPIYCQCLIVESMFIKAGLLICVLLSMCTIQE